MKMTTIIRRRKVLLGIFVAFILYLLFRLKEYSIKFDAVIKKSKPHDVWEFVSDFSNMVKLNPTIKNFHVHDEKGNVKSWMYSVSYTEHLSYLPFIENYAFAELDVKRYSDHKFAIESTHRTCFLTDYTCLNSWSTFTFESDDTRDSTRCEEHVVYQCPVIFSLFCKWEVLYQRRMIASNLQEEFRKRAKYYNS